MTLPKTGETGRTIEVGADFLCLSRKSSDLKNISLSIPKGQRLAIVGKNGAGEINLRKPSCGFITQKGNTTPLEAKISSRRGQGTGWSESAGSCKTLIK